MAIAFTPQQQNAIDARGGAVLVSAAAGSGKTAVLVERVVGRILEEEHPIDADKLLVVTFSNAAANEMKGRISARLAQLSEQRPEDARLARQLLLVEQAQISTIHSFCLELLRSSFQQLDLPPDFRIADENEMRILRARAAEEMAEEAYRQGSPVFLSLVELLSNSRSDKGLMDAVMRLYDFVRSHAFYPEWLAKNLAQYHPAGDVAETRWAQVLFAQAEEGLAFALAFLDEALARFAGDAPMEKAYGECFRNNRRDVSALLELAKNRDWDGFCAGLWGFSFGRLGGLRSYPDEAKKERVTELRQNAKNIVEKLSDQFCANRQGFLEDLEDLAPKVECLFDLALDFDRRLDVLKREKKAVDFSDLEHFALRLLYEGEGEERAPSSLAKELAARFEEILVDECQDINEAQEQIFAAISRQGKNLFLVGDVKQSIYRFRQAMPELFLAKKNSWAHYDGSTFPAKILLSRNFRSREEITGGVNYLFSQLMSERVGEIAYNREEELIPGASYPPGENASVEAVLLDVSESELDSAQAEARYVAERIDYMPKTGYKIYRDDKMQPVRPRDICILLRSPKDKAERYIRELAALGVNAWADLQGGYLSSREVSVIVSLLRAIDNPFLDIPLTAVMLSPLFGFTADEAAALRLLQRGGPMYGAVRLGAAQGNQKAADLLAFLQKYRQLSATLTARELLSALYAETDFLSMVQVMKQGEGRRANLLLLLDYAYRYEGAGYRGLSGFLRFLEDARERDADLEPAASLSENADVVQIMSIHKSKGLQFPIVFLADCCKQFNKTDLNGKTLFHSQGGFACVRRDKAAIRQFTTIPREAVRVELEQGMLSEEMRVLYVALTRAKECLILTMASQNPARLAAGVDSWAKEEGRLSPFGVLQGKSYGEWLLAALLRHPDAEQARGLLGLPPLGQGEALEEWRQASFKVTLEKPRFEQQPEQQRQNKIPREGEQELFTLLQNRLEFTYPYAFAVNMPAKLAVSQVAEEQEGQSRRLKKRPRFLLGEKLNPAEKGSALHKFMQFCDYAAARESPEQELLRLERQGYLLPEERQAVNPERIRRFFEGPLAARIFKAKQVWRELRFLALMGEEELGRYRQDIRGTDKTTLQGVADCVFLEENGGVIVDYKTDYVTGPEQLLEQYGVQLRLYRQILEKSLGIPVKECVIYSFGLEREITVNPQELEKTS